LAAPHGRVLQRTRAQFNGQYLRYGLIALCIFVAVPLRSPAPGPGLLAGFHFSQTFARLCADLFRRRHRGRDRGRSRPPASSPAFPGPSTNELCASALIAAPCWTGAAEGSRPASALHLLPGQTSLARGFANEYVLFLDKAADKRVKEEVIGGSKRASVRNFPFQALKRCLACVRLSHNGHLVHVRARQASISCMPGMRLPLCLPQAGGRHRSMTWPSTTIRMVPAKYGGRFRSPNACRAVFGESGPPDLAVSARRRPTSSGSSGLPEG